MRQNAPPTGGAEKRAFRKSCERFGRGCEAAFFLPKAFVRWPNQGGFSGGSGKAPERRRRQPLRPWLD